MKNMDYLEELNYAQAQAAIATEGAVLVLAGAGSGKTRLLAYRIRHIIESELAKPGEILAITFTNKAAEEMKNRLGNMLGTDIAKGLWVTTFHSFGVRILRRHAEKIGYSKNFTIYDDSNSLSLVKQCMKELKIDEKRWNPNMVKEVIASYKLNTGIDVYNVIENIYKKYQEKLQIANSMDFADLLKNTIRLFTDYPDILEKYQKQFKYVLVDEFQDTNNAQYQIIKMLSQKYGNIMLVGDDAQNIYSFQGANMNNILFFNEQWPINITIKLERNYRSKSNILNAANTLISYNSKQIPKNLYTHQDKGELIEGYVADDEKDEARYVADEINKLRKDGFNYNDVAVFYRTNAQSRALEDVFLKKGVPYKIMGGTEFFKRAEIKDFMAYLRLAVNPDDDMALLRVINMPKRGIGDSTLEKVKEYADTNKFSLYRAFKQLVYDSQQSILKSKTLEGVKDFLSIFSDDVTKNDIIQVITHVMNKSGITDYYRDLATDDAKARLENLKEFLGVAQDYIKDHPNTNIEDFVEWLSLRSDLDNLSEEDEFVVLMTVHSSKGLEFPVVFITGLEEQIFPHINSMESEKDLEEERRLAYVAITRAKERLYLTRTRERFIYGQRKMFRPSRFIDELPEEVLSDKNRLLGKSTKKVNASIPYKKFDDKPSFAKKEIIEEVYAVGERIHHAKFGDGKIVSIDGDAISVRFGTGEIKKLLLGYAPITKI